MDQETVFEWGLMGLAGAVVAGLVIFFGSELAGELLRAKRHRERPPAPGSIPPERHHHVIAPAPH